MVFGNQRAVMMQTRKDLLSQAISIIIVGIVFIATLIMMMTV